LEALVSNLGADGATAGEPITDDAGRTWETHRAALDGSEVAVFLTEADGATLVVLLQGPADRLDQLTADPIPAILSEMQAG
jgi:hypothetical protein